MIILHNAEGGFKVGPFEYLGGNPNIILKEGDVGCYNNASPLHVNGNDTENEHGFIINAWAGNIQANVVSMLAPLFVGQNKFITFWRKTGKTTIKPPHYVESEWSKPVPLP